MRKFEGETPGVGVSVEMPGEELARVGEGSAADVAGAEWRGVDGCGGVGRWGFEPGCGAGGAGI